MNIADFNTPTQHPYGILRGYGRAHEKEMVLAIILKKCIEAGGFVAVETVHNHPAMVRDGLLEQVADRRYKLTPKAKGLLYSEYGKA